VEGINESLVEDSLQKGKIISLPFLHGYTDVLCNRSIPENLDLSFNAKSVPITTSQKHLGVTFSNDAKWNTRVDIFRVVYLNI
jgi:trimethylamine:corrinoid methyltransferase-like protein